ncbi:MAG: DNA mismatch repair endonuclease MutL [Blastocatellia bacterium]
MATNKIHVLPDVLANKIAAGEVVERPASIVKELIENAIDAGARRIEIAIEGGGRQLIRITDDGEGMSRDDALLAFERHATSKLRVAEDLEAITTLGFRGEALGSIASVAKLRLRTQTAQDLIGTEVTISGGRVLSVQEIAVPTGAEFEIRDLFFNVPARRKFLKSDATESFHIANLVTHYALSHPSHAFRLTHNQRESLRVTPAEDLRTRAYQLFGEERVADLIEVSLERGEMRVRGFVSSPSIPRTNRESQYFFINGRYVRDRVMGRALGEAYRAMMPAGSYPTAMLFLEIPPREVDVNVHPAKTEVRFVRSQVVQDLVRDAVLQAIRETKAAVTPFGEETPLPTPSSLAPIPRVPTELVLPNLTAGRSESGERRSLLPAIPEQLRIGLRDGAEDEPSPLRALRPEDVYGDDPLAPDPLEEHGTELAPASPLPSLPSRARLGCLGSNPPESAGSPLRAAQNLTLIAEEITTLGQLHQSFIVAADRAGLLLIDQHVAHERILFEEHWASLRRRQITVQRLLLPEAIDLTPAQALAIEELLPTLEENGFEIGRLSGRTLAIHAVPAILSSQSARALLLELLDTIGEERRNLSLDGLHAEIAASLACRAAVKIHMPLAAEKMRWMIDQLLRMENPATCPHGRPIILRLTAREIEKGFQR